jgi:hypothetical protein
LKNKEKKEEYIKKLRDPKWQKIRLKILERDEWHCQQCGNAKETLHVHHRYYEKGKEPWDYPLEALITLCEFCHEGEKEQLSEYEPLLLQQLRKHFFAADLREIAWGFHEFKIQHMSQVHASALAKFLGNEELQWKMIHDYLYGTKYLTQESSHGSEISTDNIVPIGSGKN